MVPVCALMVLCAVDDVRKAGRESQSNGPLATVWV